MRLALLIAFILFPLAEIALLVELSEILGFWPTVGLIFVTAAIGVNILQTQGFSVLRRSQEAISEGHPPVEPVIDGLFYLISGMLLISPGVLSDCAGLILLVPPLRKVIARWCFGHFFGDDLHSEGVFTTAREPGRESPHRRRWRNPSREAGANSPRQAPRRDGPVIEGEFERLDETPVRPRPRDAE